MKALTNNLSRKTRNKLTNLSCKIEPYIRGENPFNPASNPTQDKHGQASRLSGEQDGGPNDWQEPNLEDPQG